MSSDQVQGKAVADASTSNATKIEQASGLIESVLANARPKSTEPDEDPWTDTQVADICGAVKDHCGPATAARLRRLIQAAQAPAAVAEVPDGMVLVKAYAECGKYADDNPGLRADCAEKLERGEPCEKCPKRAGRAVAVARDNTAAMRQAQQALSLALSDVDWRTDSPTQPVIYKAHLAVSAALSACNVPVHPIGDGNG